MKPGVVLRVLGRLTSLLRPGASTARPVRRASEKRARLESEVEHALLYAVGDVHGHLDMLERLEEAIRADARAAGAEAVVVVHLGDAVDRGPESAGVLERLSAPPPDGLVRLCLCGNHEEAFLGFLADPLPSASWLRMGGRATLKSYGLDPDALLRSEAGERQRLLREAIPARHVDFMRALPVAISTPRYRFVHAGLRPGVPFEEQTDLDLTTIRSPAPDFAEGDRVIVHGHTPGTRPVVRPGEICVDTGAGQGGRLTAVRLRAGQVDFLSVEPGPAPGR